MEVSKMTDEQLIKEASATHDSIANIGCFGVRDLVYNELLIRELERRGFTVDEKTKLNIRRVQWKQETKTSDL